MSKLERGRVTIPTYPIGAAEPLPLFLEKRPYQGASGRLYPIPYVSSFSDDKIDREYDGIRLENKYISVLLLPEIGGKIHSALDKTTGYDFIYHNKVIKPAMVGLAGPWVSGGIEFNWPQHHRPTTFMPTDASVGQCGGESYAYMGEIDYFYNMKGMVKLSVDDEHSYIKAEITVYNGTPEAHPFMWWANLAVEVDKNYKVVFPEDVEFVNDHDRRAVLEWPIAKGVYHTARPFNYGEGTDIHSYSDVKVPCSFLVSKGQSDADFLSGYDAARGRGIVTVAEHRIAPGKKLWTWGDSSFGAKWCANLTDDGSRYVELMTGCYTDNQPDFTYIAPYETKTFEQYWYPIRDVGEVKAANRDAALNVERTGDGLFLGLYTTRAEAGCSITVSDDSGKILTLTADTSPEKPYTGSHVLEISGKIRVSVTAADGRELISYTEYIRGNKKPISPRQPSKLPKEIATVEELYLNGAHLVQYKHFSYRPEDYFLEGLARDAGDARCNAEMGKLALAAGKFAEAIAYFDRAIERLTLRNPNPYDTDPYYLRALAKFRLGELDGAYDDAYNAIWSYQNRSAGYYLLSKIAARKGNLADSAEFIKTSLKTNADNLMARHVLGILTDDGAADEQIRATDPLFFAGLESEKNSLYFADEYLDFGLTGRAKAVLSASRESAMKHYYLAYVAALLGNNEEREAELKLADRADWRCEFPSRKENIKILEAAATPMASYYLGCIYYNFERYADACQCWEETVKKCEFAPAYRGLALGYFDHLDRKNDARVALERALELYNDGNRVFYELAQMYKSMNLGITERIRFFEEHEELVFGRDDCTLAYSVLKTAVGDYAAAEKILLSHRFHTYEGGEGNLTCHHAWLKMLIGRGLLKAGKVEEARECFESGLVFPENYGEEKNYFVNDAPLYYHLAKCAALLGDGEGEKKYLALADTTRGVPTVHSYFQCEALRAAGRTERADELAQELLARGEARINTAAVNDYYGVGAPAYPPFGYDVERAHLLQGYIMAAFAKLALGSDAEADEYIARVAEIDSADFHIHLYEAIKNG